MAASIEAPSVRSRRYSLSITLAVCIGVLVAVAVASVLAVSWFAGLRNTFGFLNEKAISIVHTIETRVDNHLQPAVTQLSFLDRQIRNGHLDPSDPASFARALLGSLAAVPQVGAILYWDSDLKRTSVGIQPDGTVEFETRDDSQDDFMQQVWAEVKSTETAFWGEPVFVPDARETFLNLRHPLRDAQGKVTGFLIAVVAMRELSEFMTQIGDSFDATAFILYGQDQVLAHPNLTSPHPDLRPDNPTVAIDRVGDFVIAQYHTTDFEGPFEEAEEAGVTVGTIEIPSQEAHVAFAGQVTAYGDVPWTVGAHVPIGEVNQEFRRLMFAGGMGLVLLVASVVFAIIVGRLIAKPIRRLATGTSQIGHLELKTIEELPNSRIRELDDQASSFNSMLHGLRWFETYVPRRLVERLIKHGTEGHVGSTERELTVLFTDIVGFTATSEQMSPRETEEFLNRHFALLSTCVEAEDGTIDKFIGDALMAFWGAPDDQPDHATRACRAAKAMKSAIEQDNNRRRKAGLPAVRVRIGIHTDHVVVGNIGAPGRMNYTIVGDGVNTGQRLESLGKELDDGSDVIVLVSAATAEAVDQRQVQLHQVGHFQVKGKDAPLEVFRLKP